MRTQVIMEAQNMFFCLPGTANWVFFATNATKTLKRKHRVGLGVGYSSYFFFFLNFQTWNGAKTGATLLPQSFVSPKIKSRWPGQDCYWDHQRRSRTESWLIH